MKSRNLIPVYRLAARARRRRLRRWTIAIAVYATVVLGVYSGCRVFWGGDQTALAADLERTADRMTQTSRAVRTLQKELEMQGQALRANEAIGNQPDWSLLLATLPVKLGDDMVLRRCEVKPAGAETGAALPSELSESYVLRIAGYGRGMTSVLAFVQGLEALGLFDQVRLTRTGSEPFLSGTAISFQVECLMDEKTARAQ
jgi:Tfp pilus assembly protein PilN